jgi:ATP-dependent DNA helicase PIF1
MCIKNLDMDQGICNGSQGVIIDFIAGSNGTKYPLVKFVNGVTKLIQLQYHQSDEYPCIAVGQVPLCLAWALTIHKIQGATLKMADIDVGMNIFEYGQTYVALSRVESLDGLYLTAFNPGRIRVHEKVKAFYNQIPELEKYENKEEAAKLEDPTVKKIKL